MKAIPALVVKSSGRGSTLVFITSIRSKSGGNWDQR
jgi:hypothetical protein